MITKKLKELRRDCMRSMERATQSPSQASSSTTTKSTMYWNRRGFRVCRPQNGLEMVRPSINKFFILKLASSLMVDILQCRVPAHVIFAPVVCTVCLVSVSHMRKTCMWLKTSHDSRFAHEALCLHQNVLSSHSAQHGTQYTFSDDSAITEHVTIFQVHSHPPFDQIFNGTFADFIFW